MEVKFAFEPNEEEKKLVEELCAEDQGHLFAEWTGAASEEADQRRLLKQLVELDQAYPGGLAAYVREARVLLARSRDGLSPLAGLSAEVPDAAECAAAPSFETDRAAWDALEARGLRAVRDTAFVLVAGGVGERLGYDGIKVALEASLATHTSLLARYCGAIGALGGDTLAIMTSPATHARTAALLRAHACFGLDARRVHLLRQGAVACVADAAAHLARAPGDAYAVETKPHGHGDVHALLHASGLLAAWRAEGKRYVCLFQDTNALFFRTLPVVLGVSEARGWAMNSVAVPRAPREAVGGLCRLVDRATRAVVHPLASVEYNELPAMMPGGVEPPPDARRTPSPFVGNINELVLALAPYAQTLARTHGRTPEFVNPKYADPAARTAFLAPARLECLMQDYARALSPAAPVGYTLLPAWLAFSPMKNTLPSAAAKWRAGTPPASVASGELDQYRANARLLLAAASPRARIVHSLDEIKDGDAPGEDASEDAAAAPYVPRMIPLVGMEFEEWPLVLYSEAWAPTLAALAENVAGRCVLTARAMLVVDCDRASRVVVRRLVLDGALTVRARNGACVTIDCAAPVVNAGARITPLPDGDTAATPNERIRGFTLARLGGVDLVYDTPGSFVFDGTSH